MGACSGSTTQAYKWACALRADSIINPEAPLALRLSGQLLLGVVKVYSKKVGYLYQDCNDALQKIKEARARGAHIHLRQHCHASTCRFLRWHRSTSVPSVTHFCRNRHLNVAMWTWQLRALRSQDVSD